MVKVKQFNKPDGFACNLYILSSEKGNILIDPGFYNEEVRDYLASLGDLHAILLTHAHWDHINGLNALRHDYPQTELFVHLLDEEMLTSPQLNCSALHKADLIIEGDVTALPEGCHSIGGYSIELLHTPGHTAGSCMFYLAEEKLLFSGDTLLAEERSPTFRPQGNEAALQESYDRFLSRPFDNDLPIYCGHGPHTSFGRAKQAPFLQSTAEPNFRGKS